MKFTQDSFIIALKNAPKFIFFKLHVIPQFAFRFPDGVLHVYRTHVRVPNGPIFYYNGIMQLENTLQLVHDAFLVEPYNFDIRNKVVVDVGAAIGDTAIYFVLNGAIKVYAFEPFPNTYQIAHKNVKRNGMTGVIHLINAAVGKSGKIRVSNAERNGSSRLEELKNGTEIKILSLADIISSYNIPRHSALKVDCEGYELEVLKTTPSALKYFDQIIIEYESDRKELTAILKKAGFDLKSTTDKIAPNNGLIYAVRQHS